MSDPIDLAARLPSPDRLALFLDIDGTLVGPSYAHRARDIDPERIALLDRLGRRLGGALAILTGRSVETVDPVFAPLVLPVAGLQGADRRFGDGRRVVPVQTPDERRVIETIVTAVAAAYPDIEIEHKPAALALVYDEEHPDAPKAAALAAHHAGAVMKVILGRVAIDIVPPSASKGAGLRAFMAEPPFFGRVPVHVGDDVPDEPAFAAARDLGGFGISVMRPVTGVDRVLADYEATWAMLAAYERRFTR